MYVAASMMNNGLQLMRDAIIPATEYPSNSIVRSDDETRPLARTNSEAGTRFGTIANFAGLKNALAVATSRTATNTPGSHVTARKGIVTVTRAGMMSMTTISR